MSPRRQQRRAPERALLLLPVVLVALAALLGVGAATTPGRPAGSSHPEAVPVVGSTLVCPAVVQGPDVTTAVTAGVLGSGPDGAGSAGAGPDGAGPDGAGLDGAGPDGAGSVTAGALGAPAATLRLTTGTVATGLGASLPDAGLLLRARGAPAAGLAAQQLTRAATGARRGLEALRCTAPTTRAWFAGGSLGAGEDTGLVLADPDDADAVVDLELWSGEGPVDLARAGRGIVVPAHGRTTVPLATLAPGASLLALHLTTESGRVVAALEHTRDGGASPLGTEWVPPSPAPAARVVVPGLPAGPGERALLVTNPGQDQLQVSVRLGTGDGDFVPAGLDALQVPAGTTVRADLTAALAGSPGTATVTADGGAVLAVGLAVDGDGPARDLAYAGAVAPLAGPALVADVPAGPSQLLLGAPAGTSSVVLRVLGSPAAPRTVSVPAGTTLALPFSSLGSGPLAVQVAPGPGAAPVYAVASLREDLPDGPLAALLGLVAPVREVLRPAVVADPDAALPPRG